MSDGADSRLPASTPESPPVGAERETTGAHAPLELIDPVFDPCPVCDQPVTSVHFDGLDSSMPFTWVGPCKHRVQNSSAAFETVPTRTYALRFRHFTYEEFEER